MIFCFSSPFNLFRLMRTKWQSKNSPYAKHANNASCKKKETHLCILVCEYSISGQHIDFFDFQTYRSLQCKKIQLRLHRESCFHVKLEVLLMKLLAYRIYLPITECTQWHGFETFNGKRMTVYSKWKNVITFTDRSAIWPGTVVTSRRGCSDPLIPSIT